MGVPIPYGASDTQPETARCSVCQQELQPPFYDCDGYYICSVCAADQLRDTRKAPKWFVDWVAWQIEDFQEYDIPEE